MIKNRKKIVIIFGIISFLLFNPLSIVLAIDSIQSYIETNTLRFAKQAYLGFKKTPMSGSVEEIDINEYDRVVIVEKLNHSMIFPESITTGKISMAFFADPLFADRSFKRGQAYLEWNMDKDTYEYELERMKNIVGKKNKYVRCSNNLFRLQSYIACYNDDGYFEYALLDENNYTIRYISLCDIESIDNLLFSHDYEPKKVLKDSDLKLYSNKRGAYNIYAIP